MCRPTLIWSIRILQICYTIFSDDQPRQCSVKKQRFGRYLVSLLLRIFNSFTTTVFFMWTHVLFAMF
jgi:hypothetical protein